jgi:hypothetical protein
VAQLPLTKCAVGKFWRFHRILAPQWAVPLMASHGNDRQTGGSRMPRLLRRGGESGPNCAPHSDPRRRALRTGGGLHAEGTRHPLHDSRGASAARRPRGDAA